MINEIKVYGNIPNNYVLDKKESKEITGYASIDKPWLKYYEIDPNDIEIPSVNIFEFIKNNNINYLDNIAINYYHNQITYKTFFEKVNILANSFTKMGIEKGDNIPICSLSTPELIYSFLALNKIGAVPNMISPVNGSERLKQHLNSTNSKFLITMDIFNEKINEVINDTNIENIISFTFANSMPLTKKIPVEAKLKIGLPKLKTNANVINGNKLLKDTRNNNILENVHNDVAAIVYTSGSTGKPKAIMLSNENFVAMMIEYANLDVKMERKEKFMSVIPPFFPYGICNSICVPLSLGLETILIPKFDASVFPQVFMEYKPNHVNGVPKYWESLMDSPYSKDADISFLKNAGCGGAGMTDEKEVEVIEYFKSHGSSSKLNKGYGASEVTSAATVATLKNNEIGSAGIPLIFTNMSIFKLDTDEEISYLTGEEGEICINGPTVMLGYKDNEEKTNEVLKEHKDGKLWYHTRDRGTITKDGAFYVNGRYGRLILRRGMSIDPADIEYEISKNPLVKEVSVIKMDHSDLVEVPVACIVLKENVTDKNYAYEEIKNTCAKTLPEYSWPHEYYIIDNIPLLEGDKVNYIELENYVKSQNEVKKRILKP